MAQVDCEPEWIQLLESKIPASQVESPNDVLQSPAARKGYK